LDLLQRLGFTCAEADDPYAAMAELCARPLAYNAMIISLNCLYKEELQIIKAAKTRFPHIEIWLAHTDGRQAAMVEGVRLGADGILADDGLHRLADSTARQESARQEPAISVAGGPLQPQPSGSASAAGAAMRAAADRTIADRPGADRAGADRLGADRAGTEDLSSRSAPDRASSDQTGSEQTDSEHDGLDHRGPTMADFGDFHGLGSNEPILTADELRALLQEQPAPQSE
jgi:hypothetical protein